MGKQVPRDAQSRAAPSITTTANLDMIIGNTDDVVMRIAATEEQ